MKFFLYAFEGKELYLRQALYGRGHQEAERIDDTDLLLVDTDVPWARPRPEMITAAKMNGAKIALYPHGGLPDWTYDLTEPNPDVDLRLEHGPGSIEIADLLGLDLHQAAPGWLFSPTQPFAPVENPHKVLFAPLHPIIEGLQGPQTNGHDPAPAINQEVYKRLLALGYDLTVSIVGPPHRSGVWPHPRAKLVPSTMQFTASYQQIMEADVVVAAGTMAATAVACGKPLVMLGQENWTTFAQGNYQQAPHPELYRDLIRYPLDVGDGDLDDLIWYACDTNVGVAEWRARFIGDDGADAAVLLLERLVGEQPASRDVVVVGATATAEGIGGS